MAPKTAKAAVRSTSPSPAEEWRRHLDALDTATDDFERERALVRLVAEVVPTLPSSRRHWVSVLALLRSMQVAEGLSEELAGEPRLVVDEIELPRLDDAAVLAESALRAGVRARVFESELLTAPVVSRLLGSTSKNPRQLANSRRTSGRLLGVPHRNQYLYPSFQIDVEHGRVYEAVEQVNLLLDAVEDPWGVASWWLAPNGRLGGAVPADLLGDAKREADVVALAASLPEDDAA